MRAKTMIACCNNFAFGFLEADVTVCIDRLSSVLKEFFIILVREKFRNDFFDHGDQPEEFYQHYCDENEKEK